MAFPRFLAVFGLFAVVLSAAVASPAHRAAAQDAGGLIVTLTPSVTKAKVGQTVEFYVTVENTGAEPVLDLIISLGMPDALDGQFVDCPSNLSGAFDCEVAKLEAGSTLAATFVVRIGTRTLNGQVTADAYSYISGVSGSDEIPALKLVGSKKYH